MNALLLKVLFTVARQLAGALLGRILDLIMRAETELTSETGASKKYWVLTELKKDALWFKSYLSSMQNVVVSAVVDVLVASAKTSSPTA